MKRILLAALATVQTAVLAYGAADLTLSTGVQFLPGPRLVDGSDLNVMLGAVNTLRDQMDGTAALSPKCTVTGATPQTCNGVSGVVTTGTLTTAAVTNAAYVINNSSVTAASVIQCTDQGYSGTLFTAGIPELITCVPGAGTITVNISNTHATNALSDSVKIGFRVVN